MPSIRLEDLTPFGQLAVKLDREFAELARVGGQIEGVDLKSDAGLDEGVKILGRVAAHGEVIAQSMQEFAKALQEARDKAEAATKLVAERAQIIQERRRRQDELQQKLAALKEELVKTGEALAASHAPVENPSEDDRRRIAAELERLKAPLTRFVEIAQALKAECAGANFKRLERQADSLVDSLQASLRKLAQALASE